MVYISSYKPVYNHLYITQLIKKKINRFWLQGVLRGLFTIPNILIRKNCS